MNNERMIDKKKINSNNYTFLLLFTVWHFHTWFAVVYTGVLDDIYV